MNRFYDIPSIPSRELLPWESARRGLSVTTGQFELNLPGGLRFRSDIAGGDIIVPDGMISDLASIPDLVASIFGINTDDQRIAGGAWVHDYLYGLEGKILIWKGDVSCDTVITRKQADSILCYEAMPELGASSFKCGEAYQGLRRCGKQWNGNSFLERFT